ncbi:raftlin-like [Actinia tenebrosa]|uniref:Raftlin-like n=1 Tax=Actinia tenebrosa TaxID=6105 RepID=A0A6P8HHW3_ACTTE|nr:raftlin-like [Actinia tenebrosa]
MGGSGSKDGEPKPKHCYHSPLPIDNAPYNGPRQAYLLCKVQVKMSSNVTFGFTGGRPMVTADIDSYYPMLVHYCQQGYLLTTFYRVPFVAQMSGFASVVVPYEAIFCKPADGSPPEGGIPYELKIEKSVMQIQAINYGVITGQGTTVANTSDIIQKIAQYSSRGGRLVCVEMTGCYSSQGFSNAMRGISGDMGVDLFFNVPRMPNPPMYTYQAVSVPIVFRAHVGLATSVTVECDFMGHFAHYLNQGWKLVEIFLDQGTHTHGGFSMTAQLNSVWFFEKDSSRLNDPRPQYEGTIITYQHIIKTAFGGVKVKSDWTPLIQEMGEKGWELACLLETPEQQRTGLMTAQVKILLFFQRRIVG